MASQTVQSVRTEAVPHAPREDRSGARTDIQGLRALAVGLVLLYHLWPNRLTGGFVGVDVFFVISGFLITTHLLVKPPRHLRDLAAFWARRIRRLLPASLTVLAVTAVATRLVAPEIRWLEAARHIRSAALYVVNWRLANDAVDYSAAGNAATPVQHFWSLSVEEQFYLGWPVVIAVLLLLAALLRRRPLVVISGGLLVVVVASLLYGIWLTQTDQARAYFVTPTRVWELGVGGLLAAALVGRTPSPARSDIAGLARVAAVWAGLVAIAWSGTSYTAKTPFPGWHALVPVLGAAAVIAAADPRGFAAPGRFLAARPVQWLGDVSYSVYLWHWPMIVLLPSITGSLGRLDKSGILLATLVLAGLTKRFVEDPFRTGVDGSPLYRPYVAAAVGMALVVGMATLQVAEVERHERAERSQVKAALESGDNCFGAPALANADCPARTRGSIVPSPARAVGDQYDLEHRLLRGDCWAERITFAVRTCEFGDPKGQFHVALIGNSHAAQWLAALEKIGARKGWRITTFFAHFCANSDTEQVIGNAEQTDGCRNWVRRTTEQVRDGSFNLVVMSNRMSLRGTNQTWEQSRAAFVKGYETVLRQWQNSDMVVVGLGDTPWPGATQERVPDCLTENPSNYEACSGPRPKWEPTDLLQKAIETVDDPKIRSINLNDHICGPGTCPAVVGGVTVYADYSHLTTTYVETLAPYLRRELVGALRQAE
jgi:peptidoglycan/LPS O-acetylase OafA/YrhL